jgi:hypothetical protein
MVKEKMMSLELCHAAYFSQFCDTFHYLRSFFWSCQVSLRAYLVFLRTFLRIFSPHPPLAGQISPQNPRKSVKSVVIILFFHTFYRTFTPHGAGVFGQYKALHLSHTTGVLEYVEDWASCSNAVITKKNKSGKNLLDF